MWLYATTLFALLGAAVFVLVFDVLFLGGRHFQRCALLTLAQTTSKAVAIASLLEIQFSRSDGSLWLQTARPGTLQQKHVGSWGCSV